MQRREPERVGDVLSRLSVLREDGTTDRERLLDILAAEQVNRKQKANLLIPKVYD